MDNVKYATINWGKVPNFKKTDFSEDPDLYADPELLYTLQEYRTKSKESCFPSPVKGALARFEKTGSRHSFYNPENTNGSTALDIFSEGVPINNLSILFSIPKIGGIGIYLDTIGVDGKPWVMFHMDLRERVVPVIWIRDKRNKSLPVGGYVYPQNDPKYWGILNNPAIYEIRKYRK